MQQDSIFTASEIVDSWNSLPEDSINAPTLDAFKARLDKCWSGRKFICTKLDTKQLKSQNKDYLEGKGRCTGSLDAYVVRTVVIVMLCYVML